jgi:hypothetical protein
MSDSSDRAGRLPAVPSRVVKTCPWCRGPLAFDARFPVVRLMPGATRFARHDEIPEPLRTVPAWVCGTPHCKYREIA